MDAAMFQTPFIPPGRSPRQVFEWAVDQAIVADQAGLTEYWVGEHATQAWECIPNPELVISAVACQTERIKLAPGAHLLPYHHPASLAMQVAYLTQILEGRYILGIGAGAFPADAALRGMTDLSANHKMVVESLEMMQKIWKGEPFQQTGTYWSAGFPQAEEGHPFRDMLPYGGHVDIGLAGLSPNSPSLKFAGERGYIPLSIFSGDEFLKNHWETYSTAAAANGHTVDRSIHHVVRDVFVGETDAEAKRWAIEGGLGKSWSEYLLPQYKHFGIIDGLIKHPGMSYDAIDLEYLAEHVWLVGSPETVVAKFEEAMESSGGFGTIMAYNHDYIDNPEPWNQSIELLAREVAPKVHLPV
ncbi:LLM class flavin-dependent oxidoreductase [Pseudonocardia sp. GCM10023141]|uniref:LLM class flavin-dependent oxidoreductase n=1 Tax=Pseudonocardia sp. GCM10023141 TaxID=3252653 RepID=UPI0036130E52